MAEDQRSEGMLLPSMLAVDAYAVRAESSGERLGLEYPGGGAG